MPWDDYDIMIKVNEYLTNLLPLGDKQNTKEDIVVILNIYGEKYIDIMFWMNI